MDEGETAAPRPYHALSVIPNVDEHILQALDRGESLHSLADRFGVYRYAIQRRAYKLPDYVDIIDCAVQARMAKREQELADADDNVSVTRADRLLNHARWLAERSCPERWGQKQAGSAVNVQVVIRGATGDEPIVCNAQSTPLPNI